jgi:uncharacterized protein
MLTEEMLPGLQGALPSALATVDETGVPNLSYISQIFYVDNNHVALSNQFFNKSMRNIKSNGTATVNVVRPDNLKSWYIELKHKESKTDGELFENMKMQLAAIASMTGMEDVFKLNASEVFEVLKVSEVIMS